MSPQTVDTREQLEQLELIYNYERNVSMPLKLGMIIVCFLLTLFINREVFFEPKFYNGYIIAVVITGIFILLYSKKDLKRVKLYSFLSFAQDIAFVTFLLKFTGGTKSLLHLVYCMFFIRAAVNYPTISEILISGLGIFTPIYLIGIYWSEGNFGFLLSRYFWSQYALLWGVVLSCVGVVSLLSRKSDKIAQNLKEIKSLQAQLIQAEKMAGLGQLAGGIAHELNNPLGSILGFTQVLLRELKDDDTKRRDLLRIEKAAFRSKKIIENLLSFSRQTSFQLQQTDINQTIEDTISLCDYQLSRGGINIIKEFEPNIPKIMADSGHLQQVFMNLIINAADAMPKGGNLKIVTRKVGTPGDKPKVQAEFIDEGMGIPEENIGRIFEPFFTTKEVGKGTGLGLSIAYGIVKEHSGEIKVETKVGVGSKFTVELPLVV